MLPIIKWHNLYLPANLHVNKPVTV